MSAGVSRRLEHQTDNEWRLFALKTLATELPKLMTKMPRDLDDVKTWIGLALFWPVLVAFIVAGPEAWDNFVERYGS